MKHMVMNKIFLPCFYVACAIGIVFAGVKFADVKEEQQRQLLTIEENLNLQAANEEVKLELNEKNKGKEVIYISSDEDIVKVDKHGNLKSIAEGSVTVTVKTKDEKYSQSFIVNVGQAAIDKYEGKEPVVIPTDPTIPIEEISLEAKQPTMFINSAIKTMNIKATLTPSNASLDNIYWESSDNNVASVLNGVVTALNPGTTTITAKTLDGNIAATTRVDVKKNIIVVIGSNQVSRMSQYYQTYNSKNYSYNTNDETLVYTYKTSTGVEYQTNEGLNNVKNLVISKYDNVKGYTNIFVYFPLPATTIKTFTCKEISDKDQTIVEYVKKYNDAIKSLKDNGYNVEGHIVSVEPVKSSQSKNDTIVTNENKNACTIEYRSNYKYYQFNKAVNQIIEKDYKDTLIYEDLFTKILKVSNKKQNFKYAIAYNTMDGANWTEKTTKDYVELMFKNNNNL